MDYVSWERYGKFVNNKQQTYIKRRRNVFDQGFVGLCRRTAKFVAMNTLFACIISVFWAIALIYVFNAFSAENMLVAGSSSLIMSNLSKNWGVLDKIIS